MDHYLKYVAEREGLNFILEPEGFATYKQIAKNSVYLQDVFVLSEFRKTGVASKLTDKVGLIAKEMGCNTLITSVCTDAIGATTSLKVILAYGFELKSVGGNMIYFSKEL